MLRGSVSSQGPPHKSLFDPYRFAKSQLLQNLL
jgi:hypothetical protein